MRTSGTLYRILLHSLILILVQTGCTPAPDGSGVVDGSSPPAKVGEDRPAALPASLTAETGKSPAVSPVAAAAVVVPESTAVAVSTSLPTATIAPAPTVTPTAAPTRTPLPSATATPALTATPARAPAKTPGVFTIFVDAGHGGDDVGAVHPAADGKADLVEKELNLDVAKRLGALLTAGGYQVVQGRLTDAAAAGAPGGAGRAAIRADMQARVNLADDTQADLFIDIHHNGYGNKDVAGSETYYCADRPFAAQSKLLAQLTVDSIIKELAGIGYQALNRGIHDDLGVPRAGYHFFVLGPSAQRPTGMPAIIGEALFVTNDADAAVLRTDAGRQAIARGYFQAIRAYFQANPGPTAVPA